MFFSSQINITYVEKNDVFANNRFSTTDIFSAAQYIALPTHIYNLFMTCKILYNSISVKCQGILESQLHYCEFMFIMRTLTFYEYYKPFSRAQLIELTSNTRLNRTSKHILFIYLFICTVSLALYTVHYRRHEENHYRWNKRLRQLYSIFVLDTPLYVFFYNSNKHNKTYEPLPLQAFSVVWSPFQMLNTKLIQRNYL